MFSRTLYGGAISLGFSLAATLFSAILGIILGLSSSMGGRILRPIADWVMDVMLAFPSLILAVVIAGLLGPSALNTSLGLTAAGFAWWARFSRSLFIKAGQTDFVRAAISMGIPGPRVLRRYLFPQVMPSLLVAALLQAAGMVTAVSGMSYLGFGAQPPVPEWGSMLREAQLYMADYPWVMAGPGLAVTVSVGIFTAAGEALRRRFSLKPVTRW
ncbi:ABC transporter permease [Desulfosoma sp.]|uniref:ABC transporter permease n=1 Tax=Desulfosoma sp. TaxID=2603217 RepID=UPI00404A6B5B